MKVGKASLNGGKKGGKVARASPGPLTQCLPLCRVTAPALSPSCQGPGSK